MIHPPDLDKAKRFLALHGPPQPLVAGVTGSHFYGFPSANSDLDLKGIHIAPTEQVLGLTAPPDHVDFLGDFEGVELDYTSQELAHALRLLIKGNGNMLERIVTPLQVADHPDRLELIPLALGAVSRRFYRHYRGFFASMVAEVNRAHPPTAKALLYAYRTALTGVHLLRSGECVGDVEVLSAEYGFGAVRDLLAIKRGRTEWAEVSSADPWRSDFLRLQQALDEAKEHSRLPEDTPNVPALNDFLIRIRQNNF